MMDSWSDRQWSLWACEKAIECNAIVGSFGDRLRALEIANGDLDRRVASLEEQLAIVLKYLAEQVG